MLIRRETECDADVIRAITTAAFAPRRPGQIPPEAALIDELRAGPAWLPALSLVAVTPAGEVIGYVLGTRGHVGQGPRPRARPAGRPAGPAAARRRQRAYARRPGRG